jgi:hypothetical protein
VIFCFQSTIRFVLAVEVTWTGNEIGGLAVERTPETGVYMVPLMEMLAGERRRSSR